MEAERIIHQHHGLQKRRRRKVASHGSGIEHRGCVAQQHEDAQIHTGILRDSSQLDEIWMVVSPLRPIAAWVGKLAGVAICMRIRWIRMQHVQPDSAKPDQSAKLNSHSRLIIRCLLRGIGREEPVILLGAETSKERPCETRCKRAFRTRSEYACPRVVTCAL